MGTISAGESNALWEWGLCQEQVGALDGCTAHGGVWLSGENSR